MIASRNYISSLVTILGTLVLALTYAGTALGVYNPQANPSAQDWWYADGVLVVNFKTEALKSAFKLGKSGVKTGLPHVDQMFSKYQVGGFDQMFVGSKAPNSSKDVDLTNYYRITFSNKASLDEAVADFASLTEVEHVEKVSVHPVMVVPNDPSFSSQWALKQTNDQDIDADIAWDTESGDSSILVSAMDTGVQWDHPDLGGPAPYTNGNIWINWAEYNGLPGVDDDSDGFIDDFRGWDFVDGVNGVAGEDSDSPDNDPMDFNGHGTHTAGIMAAITNNGVGVAGVAGGMSPHLGCRIVPIRIGWSELTSGQELGYVRMDFAAQGFYYAANKGVSAINCSWGSSNDGGIAAAVSYAVAHGMVICTAAGNSNNTVASYLGTRSDVLAVASVASNGVRSSFSSYGPWVDVSAPGSSIYSTYSFHGTAGYATLSGTSMASPHVAGLAGLLRAAYPAVTKNALDTIIIQTTDNIYTLNPSYVGQLGTGRINAAAAIAQVFTAHIGSDLRLGLAPFSVNFAGTSPAQVDTWSWSFGDGDSASGQNPTHVYNAPGRYTVSLTATGPQGTKVSTMTDYVVAYADTLQVKNYIGTIGVPPVVEVRLKNYAPVTQLNLAVSYGGSMNLVMDSVSFVGSRGTAFESLNYLSVSPADYRMAFVLKTNDGGGSPPLAVGDGTLFKIFFHFGSSPTIPGLNTVDTVTYSTYTFGATTSLGSYTPVIQSGTVSLPGLRGDANADNIRNISDVIYLISYIFSGGPTPQLYNGDADSNGFLNISDAIYLISFIFAGGPPPGQ